MVYMHIHTYGIYMVYIQAQDTDLDPKAKDFFQEVDDDLRIKANSNGTILFNQLNLSRPLLRAVEAMGYVTPAAALEDYGIVFTAQGAVDEAATEQHRAQLKSKVT